MLEKPGTTRLGWCMDNTESKLHAQLRQIGRWMADLLNRRGSWLAQLARTCSDCLYCCKV